MSQILIKLGCEDLQLKRLSDNFVFSEQSISGINALLLKIEQVGKSLGRYGFTVERLLQHLEKSTRQLPKYVARIRIGNDEEIRFLFDVEAKHGFMKSQGIETDNCDSNSIQREIERNGVVISQRIDLYEVLSLIHI